jgi:hypothetical protein
LLDDRHVTATRAVSDEQRRSRLATRHALIPQARTDDIAAIADSVVALHSTDPSTVYLAALARMQHPSIDAVSKALYDDRTVVRHHAMRRTLWVMTPRVARWAHAACTVAVASVEWKRLVKMVEDSGVATDGDAWAIAAKNEILAALASMGTATARQLGKSVPHLTETLHRAIGGTNVSIGGAHTRLLLNLGFEGAIVRGRPTGSWNTAEYPWSVTENWIQGAIAGEATQTAIVELARCYISRFGPVTTADLQWWSGWTLATTRRALSAIEAVEVRLDPESGGDVGWVLPNDDVGDDASTAAPWIAFLPALDSTTMGWKNRAWYLGELAAFGGPMFDVNGNAGPTIWVDGRVVGGWAQRSNGDIAYRLVLDVPRTRATEIAAEATRLRDLIGDTRVKVRFPAPLQKELLA